MATTVLAGDAPARAGGRAGELGLGIARSKARRAPHGLGPYCDHRRHLEEISSVTAVDVFYGHREEIVQRRKEVTGRTLRPHRDYYRAGSEQETGRQRDQESR